MSWAAIIEVIISVVGPILKKWLADWLESLLKQTAATMDAPGGNRAIASRELLEEAYAQLWWFQFAKRRLLAAMAESVPPAVGGAGLTPAAHGELARLAAACG